jgi:hypothetical protein
VWSARTIRNEMIIPLITLLSIPRIFFTIPLTTITIRDGNVCGGVMGIWLTGTEGLGATGGGGEGGKGGLLSMGAPQLGQNLLVRPKGDPQSLQNFLPFAIG